MRREKKDFEVCYMEYVNKVYGLAYRMVNNHQDAIDITQEVFLRAYKNWNSFKGLSKISTWLYRIAVNVTYDFLKKRNRFYRIENLNIQNFPVANNPGYLDYEKKIYQEEIIEEIKKEINNLTEKQRLVFILKTYNELTYEEIGKILKKPVGTVKATYFQSLQKIRENLRKKGVIKDEM